MPGTPSKIKLNMPRSSYSRVPLKMNLENPDGIEMEDQDANEPLQGGNHVDKFNIESCVNFINYGTDEQMEVYGYCKHKIRTLVTWFFIIITFGALRLVFHWKPHWMLFATHRTCPLDIAQKVLVIEWYQRKHKRYYVKNIQTITADNVCNNERDSGNVVEVYDSWDEQAISQIKKIDNPLLPIHMSKGIFKEMEYVRMFSCKKICYVWDPEKGEFFKLTGLDDGVTTGYIHMQKGLSVAEQFLRRAVCAKNEILVPMRGIITLLFLEVLNPFYVFQIFSFILWYFDDYVLYAISISIITSVGVVAAVRQTRLNQRRLHNTIHSTDTVSVVRRDTREVDVIPTELLVPGDLIIIPAHGCVMHCDAVLLSGNCIVNESMLTGESVPVTKTPLPNSDSECFNEKEHARHILFCGTHVIQTRYYGNENVYAIVVRTGFSTSKGCLVRSILYPPPVDFKFEVDSYKFVQLLTFIAGIGFVYTVISKALRGIRPIEIAFNSLDLITIVVPPALPAAMTIGRTYAQSRLEKKNVYCISPRTLNVSGSIDCVCFDKTGTLTEDGLDMWGVVPVENNKFLLPLKTLNNLPFSHLLSAMVTCHSITIIDGMLNGEPLDLKMFECTGWVLEEPQVNENNKFDLISPTIVKPPKKSPNNTKQEELELEIGIVRQFPFSSSLQRMSVISRTLGANEFTIYCKGSPEMIQSLSRPDTIPHDFSQNLELYTQKGYRVIGLAYRKLPSRLTYAKIQRLIREEVEIDLCFLGLLILENRLKPQTTGVINALNTANIRTIMVTGDNVLTALSVARDCGIVPLGKRVITVSSNLINNNPIPSIFYTKAQHKSNRNSSIDSPTSEGVTPIQEDKTIISDESSCLSYGSVDSTTATTIVTANGIAHNSMITDVETPISNNVFVSHDYGVGTNYSFALTGATWSDIKNHYPELIPKIITRGAVFSRMSPDHKQQLIQELQSLGYYVAMCGDGANDCGALKAAHTGISLSDSESSVASPFTSKDPNIECVTEVIREGRAALVTSFGIFKFMAGYSLLQFFSVMILYSIDSNLSDLQYLYIDLILITSFAFFLGRTPSYSGHLATQPPLQSLISLTPVVSLMLQLVTSLVFQLISFFTVKQYDWFVPYNSTATDSPGCFENYAVFTTSSLHYVVLALIFSKGPPYRESLMRNWGLLISTVIAVVFNIYLILDPADWVAERFELVVPSYYNFKIVLIGIGFGYVILSLFFEKFVCDYLLFEKLRRRRERLGIVGSKQYLHVEKELNDSHDWPPLYPPIPSSYITSDVQNRLNPPRSPLTITMVPPTQNGSLFNFPPKEIISGSEPRLENTNNRNQDINNFNNISTIPRRIPFSEKAINGASVFSSNNPFKRRHNLSERSVDKSEDSLACYITPPESMHSSEQEVIIDIIKS